MRISERTRRYSVQKNTRVTEIRPNRTLTRLLISVTLLTLFRTETTAEQRTAGTEKSVTLLADRV